MSDDAGSIEGERLQKIMARTGIGSRRVSEDLISAGRVTINGRVAVLGARATEADEIAVDGKLISTKIDGVTYLLNKPKGVVTTAKDTHDRPTVIELVPDEPRVFPVGRLDLDTEGLLLLTNDGQLANRLTHPRYGIEKEYLAHVRGSPGRAALRTLREGVNLDDGITSPAAVSVIAPGLVRLTIHEGRNRQVRRMCEAVGHPVLRLARSRIGPITDTRLAPGQWRLLTNDELLDLQRAVRDPDPEGQATVDAPSASDAIEAGIPTNDD